MLEDFPGGMRRATRLFSMKRVRPTLDGGFKIEMRMATFEQFQEMGLERFSFVRFVGHG
jgi:hypothetical protein